MRRILICVLVLTLLLACAAGCSKKETEPPATTMTVSKPMVVETITPEPETEPEIVTPAEPVEANPRSDMINPFTGETVEESIIGQRPFFVMVNNIILAQPQVGISKADMIWELMEEGGITRMMAFFTDLEHVETVGSIRSARYYNVNITQAYDAIIVHAGGSDEALAYIEWDHINNVNALVNEGTEAFYRDGNRQSYGVEHSLFGRGAQIVELAEGMGYPQEHDEYFDGTYGLSFSENAADQCTGDASKINITYAGGKTTNFTYDAEKGMYSAEQFGNTYADNGEEVVYFTNVLILNAETRLEEDGLHLEIDLEEGGSDGFFCCGGKYLPIKWVRDGYEDVFHFYTMDDEPLELGVGKTFVAVQQTGSYQGTTEFIA